MQVENSTTYPIQDDNPVMERTIAVRFHNDKHDFQTTINGTRQDIINNYKGRVDVGTYDETKPNEGSDFQSVKCIDFLEEDVRYFMS